MTGELRHDTQIRQIARLRQQVALPGEKGTHAAVCLAHLVKPGSSMVSGEALDTLLALLQPDQPALVRQRAAWALSKIAEAVDTSDLSERIVPGLIGVLEAPGVDVRLARQVYVSLLNIGTPDAFAAVEAYRNRLIDAKRG